MGMPQGETLWGEMKELPTAGIEDQGRSLARGSRGGPRIQWSYPWTAYPNPATLFWLNHLGVHCRVVGGSTFVLVSQNKGFCSFFFS